MRETAHTMIPNLSFCFWQTAMTELYIQYGLSYNLWLQKELGIMALSFRLFSGKILMMYLTCCETGEHMICR